MRPAMRLALVPVMLAALVMPGRCAAVQLRSDPALASLWSRLDEARKYRYDVPIAAGRVARKSYDALVDSITGYPSVSGELESIAAGFKAFLGQPAHDAEARLGFQETLNEIMAGQTLLGNDQLLKGLRTRYPGPTDPRGRDPRELLDESGTVLRRGIDAMAGTVLVSPGALRAGGSVNTDYPFWVENTPSSGAQGELVENEFYRLTELANRHGLARNEAAKRVFFFAGEQRGAEQGSSAYQAELEKAVRGFKEAGQTTYLLSAVLAAGQSERDFRENNGDDLEREVSDAQLLFDNIRQGINPLQLVGDKIPQERIEDVLCRCKKSTDTAKGSELGVIDLARQFDEDETELTRELQTQRTAYEKRLFDQMGAEAVTPSSTVVAVSTPTAAWGEFDLADPAGREAYLDLTENRDFLYESDADIPNAYKAFDGARIELRSAQAELRNIRQQIAIEEQRAKQVMILTLTNGTTLAALDVAKGVAVSSIPDVSSDGKVTYDMSAAIEGVADAGKSIVQSINDAAISNTESEATIKNLLLAQATQLIAIERATLAVRELEAAYTALIGDQTWNVKSFLNVRADLARAYFTNPAYRVALDQQRRASDDDFRRGQADCFEAAKALEYEWAERVSNPVKRPPLAAVSLGFDAVVRAESVFAVRSAGAVGAPEPGLGYFYAALDKWHGVMTQNRTPNTAQGNVTLSLKRQILGFGSPDEDFNRLAFRDFVAKHRVRGTNNAKPDLVIQFPIQIANRRVLPLPNEPNLKLGALVRDSPLGISVKLRSVPGRAVYDPNAFANPPEVKLFMADKALVRTFAARIGEDDDVLTLDLAGATRVDDLPFRATVQASVDDQISGFPNSQLQNLSPAVTRWTLKIDMDANENRPLRLEYLDDIEITFNYRFGKPPRIIFPQLCTS